MQSQQQFQALLDAISQRNSVQNVPAVPQLNLDRDQSQNQQFQNFSLATIAQQLALGYQQQGFQGLQLNGEVDHSPKVKMEEEYLQQAQKMLFQGSSNGNPMNFSFANNGQLALNVDDYGFNGNGTGSASKSVSNRNKSNMDSPSNLGAGMKRKNGAISEPKLKLSEASYASDEEEDKEERLRKRRSQIAAASRKSRAKRKQELVTLKEENEKLWTEVVSLKKKLRELNGGSASDDDKFEKIDGGENNDLGENDNESGDEEASQNNGTKKIERDGEAAGSEGDTKESNSVVVLDDNENGDLDLDESDREQQLQSLIKFFRSRLSSYFTQLKSDTITHFAADLPYSSKQVLANLEIKLSTSSTVNKTDKSTPSSLTRSK